MVSLVAGTENLMSFRLYSKTLSWQVLSQFWPRFKRQNNLLINQSGLINRLIYCKHNGLVQHNFLVNSATDPSLSYLSCYTLYITVDKCPAGSASTQLESKIF